MAKLPVDAPIRKVIKALERLGFRIVREGNHIAMVRQNLMEESKSRLCSLQAYI